MTIYSCMSSEATAAGIAEQLAKRGCVERSKATPAMSLRERLELHSIPEPNSGCLLWTGHLNDDGYGKLGWEDRMQGAHRLSWTVHKGPIPDGLQVLHRCDVPSCINPDHLFLGTHADNMADMLAKGRRFDFRGENAANVKLTEAEVREILRDPRPQKAIAEAFGVSDSAIWMIKNRRVWRHVK